MSSADFLIFAGIVSFAILSLAFFLTILRIILGPTLPDRVIALDMLVYIGIGYIAVVVIYTGYFLYLDIAIALGLVGFLATVAFARFILHRGRASEQIKQMESEPEPEAKKKRKRKL